MGTRSFIITTNPKDDCSGIYCHWDGYPEGVGRILEQHYTKKSKVRKLINLGDISSLRPLVEPTGPHSFDNAQDDVTVAYARDRGEKGTSKRTGSLGELVEIAADMWCEYVYLFFNGVWHYLPTNEALERNAYKTVEEAIREKVLEAA